MINSNILPRVHNLILSSPHLSLQSISSHTKILSGKDDWFSIYIEPALGGTDRWSMDPFPLPQHIHTFAKIVISKKKIKL